MNKRKIVLLLAIVALAATLLIGWGRHLSLDVIAEQEQALREAHDAHPFLMGLAAFGLYYVLTSLAIPGTWTLSVVYGWLFGFWTATIAVSFAATAGATTSMLLARYLFREYVIERFGSRLETAQTALNREGPLYLFLLRLLWMIPAFVVNLVMSLTTIRVTPFWIATQLGLLPGIALHVFAGAQLKPLHELAKEGFWGLFTPMMVLAFAALAIFPLMVKLFSIWLRRRANLKISLDSSNDPGAR